MSNYTNSINPYNKASLNNLDDRTANERFILDEVYGLTGKWNDYKYVEDINCWPYAEKIQYSRSFMTTCSLSETYRSQFRSTIAPMLFVTSFKILDMIVEWVVESNRQPVPLQFKKKIDILSGSSTFKLPDIFINHPWLKTTLINLYKELCDFRNVIVHRKTFTNSNGVLHMEFQDKDPNKTVKKINLTDTDIANISEFSASLVNLLLKGKINMHEELFLQICADKLPHVHHLPKSGRSMRIFVRINYFIPDECVIREVPIAELLEKAKSSSHEKDIHHELVVIFSEGGNSHIRKLDHTQFSLAPDSINLQYLQSNGIAAKLSANAKRHAPIFPVDIEP
ncbi:hypothetical protein [Comamonas sp.]|uniref:hypothetical protein n=1 Tax=Comamonas sp. TaxID=34028 RepID=UPI002899673F|nr:hypothetical protein [Comamonas sp.]